MSAPFLSVERLVVRHPRRRTWLGRVDGWSEVLRGVSLPIPEGRTLALVGESGSGKSTFARALLRLAPAAAGSARLADGRDVLALAGEELRAWRRGAQMVHQDPYTSLDPRWRALDLVAEPLRIAGEALRAARRKAGDLLARVGFTPDDFAKYPHEFSGGQRQRIGIARALVLSPRFLVGDEPVSALDVSIQAQILALLDELRRAFGLTLLFISHDLAACRALADECAVLHAGRVVEHGPADLLFAAPLHPYTRELLAASPELGRPEAAPAPPAAPVHVPAGGCPFAPRCPRRAAACDASEPPLLEHLPGRAAACHFPAGDPAAGMTRREDPR